MRAQCSCGVIKTVTEASLVDGRTRSCGAPLCKVRKRVKVKPDPEFRPRMPRAIGLNRLARAYNAYHDPGRVVPRRAVAEKYGMVESTFQNLLAAIDKCGGWDGYVARLKGE